MNAPLLPSLQAAELRRSITDYLATTFALTDDDVRAALQAFLMHPERGIFRGPYARLRLPFAPAVQDWQRDLDWSPVGFTPHTHQAAAWARLSSKHRRPLPTLVTTGTGSGKTEAFLIPVLDHVRRARAAGQVGIKALILYPMNALANDQAGRLARTIAGDERLAGVSAGLYTGEEQAQRTKVTKDGLITSREFMRDDPPDILLTNYKMLDQLLLRAADVRLWTGAGESLTYLVLDEFHTYDGAQGTDVAMLLRRLGSALGLSRTDAPLGDVTPVATSATLGGGSNEAFDAMRQFAATVFGLPFDSNEMFGQASVIRETRVSGEEWLAAVGHHGEAERYRERPRATAGALARAIRAAAQEDDSPVRAAEALLAALVDRAESAGDGGEQTALGQHDAARLRASDALPAVLARLPLTRELLAACSRPTGLADVAGQVLPDDASPDRADGILAVEAYLALLSLARAQAGDAAGRSLLGVDTQLWVREVSRVDRAVATTPAFRWSDDGAHVAGQATTDNSDAGAELYLPALYCRHCGRAGWGAMKAGPTGNSLDPTAAARAASRSGDRLFRALIHAPGEAAAVARGTGTVIAELRFLDPRSLELHTASGADLDDELRVPVLTNWDDDAAARREECPSCNARDAIRFLGSSISTLTSVALAALFGSPHLETEEKKSLLFTDSVQDAAYLAGFVQSRSHTLSLRAAVHEVVPGEPLSLPELSEAIRAYAVDPVRRYRLVPPALSERDRFRPYWSEQGTTKERRAAQLAVGRRLDFDLALEFGLNSRTGRTLELTGSVVAEVDLGSTDTVFRAAQAAIRAAREQHTLSDDLDAAAADGPQDPDRRLRAWVRGVLERMRTQGGIAHPWLDSYLDDDGNRWFLTGGRGHRAEEGLPAFSRGRPAPTFPTSKSIEDRLDGFTALSSWYARWAERQLRVTPRDGALLTRALFERATQAGWVTAVSTRGGATVYRLPSDRILVGLPDPASLAAGDHAVRCDVCRTLTPGAIAVIADLHEAACLRQGCPGRLRRAPRGEDYYRRLYAGGDMRRVVAREHTSLLPDAERLLVEEGFKHGAGPDSPNVLAATPTLELGIDIGDLSTVLLASLPRSVAAYVQRIGRAGRLTGNALVIAFARGRGLSAQRLAAPLSMIDGDVRPPATYLDAMEILQRQYVAWLFDRRSRESAATRRSDPRNAAALFADGWEKDTVLGDLLNAAVENASSLTDEFLALFGSLVRPDTAEALRGWAGAGAAPDEVVGIQGLVHRAVRGYHAEVDELRHREQTLADRIPELEAAAASALATVDDMRDLKLARSELRYVRKRRGALEVQPWIAALEQRSVLPNYRLLDDRVFLDVTLRWVDPDTDELQEEPRSYDRGSPLALTEWAPGATFYAQGVAVRIDALDVGTDLDSVLELWRMCAHCGAAHVTRVASPQDAAHPAPACCPRCGDPAIADTGQVVPVVPLARVSAQIRRDEAAITDARDERDSLGFNVVSAADIDPDAVTDAWQLRGYPFGAEYVRAATIRWVNLGRRGASGADRILAGRQIHAPLFTVCPGCGVVPAAQGRDPVQARHRAWCPHRKEISAPWREVALGRTLRTQAVRLLVPPQFALDAFAAPSFRTALLLGLREILGGDPDHLAILEVQAPVEGQDRLALLLHDVVPGGTGYLADFARPDRVRELLHAAYESVRACPCGDRDVLACPSCLLPFARAAEVPYVSRARAEQLLADILTEPVAAEGGSPIWRDWNVDSLRSVVDIPAPSPESHLEQRFRTAFLGALKARGATITEKPQLAGSVAQIGMPGSRFRRWTLRPQVLVAGCKPDFELLSDDPAIPAVYVFTDGRRWHATAATNRVADDAVKRAGLRTAGHLVWAVTADDLTVFEAIRAGQQMAPPRCSAWFGPQIRERLTGLRNADTPVVPAGSINDDLLAADAVTQLVSWVTDPNPDGWRRLATGLPLAFIAAPDGTWARHQLPAVARALLTGGPAPDHAVDGLPTWSWRTHHLVFAATSPTPPAAFDASTSLVLDDSDDALTTAEGEAAWRIWLGLSNVLGHASTRLVDARTAGMEPGPAPDLAYLTTPGSQQVMIEIDVPPRWRRLLDAAIDDRERHLLHALAQETRQLPEQGYELPDGTPLDLAWPDLGIAVIFDADPGGVYGAIRRMGWRVLGPDLTGLLDLLPADSAMGTS
ncbi:MAG: DEAD/DEAH box helicase [Sporichthyaceae bacterium]